MAKPSVGKCLLFGIFGRSLGALCETEGKDDPVFKHVIIVTHPTSHLRTEQKFTAITHTHT